MVNSDVNLPRSPIKGKSTSRKTPETVLALIRLHIDSFIKVDSHYCRKTSQRGYLEENLSITAMFNLFIQLHPGCNVKESVYRDIFNKEFNLAFYKPRKDQCDLCYQYKNLEPTPKFLEHTRSKIETHEERTKDLGLIENKTYENNNTCVVTFDLEKVFPLPKAVVSSFYYKRKLTCYNLTAHSSLNDKTYCAVWDESMSGRGADEIASCMVKILNCVVRECPQIVKIILWSDSCVPQNRNSIMSFALKKFQLENKIPCIEQKYCEPGHSSVQKIDAVHSKIEKQLKYRDIYSPPALYNCLKAIPDTPKVKLVVLEMKKNDFKNYSSPSKLLVFKSVPYMTVKHLVYNLPQPFHIYYKTLFSDIFVEAQIVKLMPQRRSKNTTQKQVNTLKELPHVYQLDKKIVLPKEKISDLKSMILKYAVAAVDKEFYDDLFKKYV